MRSGVPHTKAHLYIALIDVCMEYETPLARMMGACASPNWQWHCDRLLCEYS